MNEFNHSTRTPLVSKRPTELGTINVTSLKRMAASIPDAANSAPSNFAPLPALPRANP